MKSTYISVLVFTGLAFSYMLWKVGIPSTGKNWMIMVLASFSGGTIGTIISMFFNMLCILAMSTKNSGVLGEHYYQVRSDGLHERTSANEGLSKWKGISEIKVTDSYLFFRITGYLYHIIPKRSFSSQREFDDFILESQQYWEKAHNPPVHQSPS